MHLSLLQLTSFCRGIVRHQQQLLRVLVLQVDIRGCAEIQCQLHSDSRESVESFARLSRYQSPAVVYVVTAVRAVRLTEMDVVASSQSYISKVVEGSSIKVLLLDPDTTSIISLVSTQSYLLQNEVYLVDRLANKSRERMRHLKALLFVRPTSENVQLIVEELREPKYSNYNIVFTNCLSRAHLERMAEADEFEVVKSIHEYYADFLAINTDLYSLATSSLCPPIYGPSSTEWNGDALARCSQGLAAVLLSLKRRPAIRYERNSLVGQTLAREMQRIMETEDKLFDFTKIDTPAILLILDRKNDPITPLLTQWTYQAMVHDQLTIRNGRVTLPNEREDLRDIVLTADADPFFSQNMFLNFGDLGGVVKSYVESYQARTDSNKKMDTIGDMKKFIEQYPEFRKLSGNVSKHVALMSELSRVVSERKLLEVSELEQSFACNDSHTNDLRTLQQLLGDEIIQNDAKLRLVLLYALRYERHPQNALPVLLSMLDSVCHMPAHQISLIDVALTFAGASARQEELFDDDSFFSKARSGIKGLKGVENVYTQHRPHLEQTLLELSKARLSTHLFPYGAGGGGPGQDRPQEIIVCMVGGVTYEEAKVVREFNTSVPGVRVVLGGTDVINARQFVQGLEEASERWPAKGRGSAKGRLSARVDTTR